jgi:predicted metal-dependent HD superfamily phosphohydrolase
VPEPQVFGHLCDRYTEPHRAYHTLHHLADCLSWLDRAYSLAENPGAIALALWFHDAIYDTHRADNEAQSANWAVQVVHDVGGGPLLQQAVHDMILATQHDAAPVTGDMRLVVDSDLAILGAPPDRFAQYEAQIRQEYAGVPEVLFRQKRTEVIQTFLARPSIFAVEFFQRRLEQSARQNLHRSLATLL